MKNVLTNNGVIDLSYEIFQENKKGFIGYSAVTSIIVSIMTNTIITVMYILFAFGLVFVTSNNNGDAKFSAIIVVLGIVCVLALIPVLALTQMIGAGPIQAVDAYRRGLGIRFSDMFNFTFKKILYILTSSTAYMLTSTVFITLVGGAIFFIFWKLNTVTGLQIFLCIIIFLFSICVFIWFSIRTLFYLPIALYEKKHFFKAIIQSFRMTRGRFFSLFKLMFTYVLSFSVISFNTQGLFMAIPVALIAFFSNQMQDGFGMFIIVIVAELLMIGFQFISSVFIAPLMYLPIPTAYFSERNLKYGDDLNLRIDILITKQKKEGLQYANANI